MGDCFGLSLGFSLSLGEGFSCEMVDGWSIKS